MMSRWLSAMAFLLSSSAAATALGAEPAESLRLCFDPANLPFSSADPKTPGLYVEIGEAVGQAMGRAVTPVWTITYLGKRAVRTSLLAGKCDAEIGLPRDPDFMGPKLVFSKPILHVGYTLVVPESRGIASLDDLRGERVAVQFGTTPQNLLASRDDIQAVTFREPEEAMSALANRDVDAAFIWGPIAGYLNKTVYADTYRVTPMNGPGLQWPVAIGFAGGQNALREQVDGAIDRISAEIEVLATKYGFPTETPIKLGNPESSAPKLVLAAAEEQQDATPTPVPAVAKPAAEAPPSGNQDTAAAGRELFDGTCAHCHGPGAVTTERRINLRLLQRRYGEKMDETFMYTVTHGRPEKGMPNWSGVFTEDQFAQILSFLHTVQTR
ncbi:MAG: transporter substrate-binding domain-containing protein [Acetobacteraceae bacterium]|nr:transporter substrate-binding domain-containing protein [Acetobacteraceae bacterium]